jgi:UDP-GlcNAc:undecaprenyl-phosphate/decaprenyl-phosphate GlcNAc-1-phosphate transferase
VKRALAAAAAGGASALAARGAYAGLRRWPPAGDKTWTRTNHRGETVTLLEGPALAAGAVTVQLAAAAIPARRFRGDLAAAAAGLGALGFGVLDDLRGSAKRKGLRGHLGALAHGEVTTGTVKLAGLAATGLAAALIDAGLRSTGAAGDAPGTPGRPCRAGDVIVNAGLIAGGANLLNLFDLRPGRAIKVAGLSAALIAAGGALTSGAAPERQRPAVLINTERGAAGRFAGLHAVAMPAGAALALLPEDLGERAMLGDAGANALGAMLGAAAARALPRPARIGLLAAIAALTVASEKVSFTQVIAATPPLRWLDMAGRRPAPLAAPVAGESASTPVRRRGRHRRAAARVSRTRSGAWVSAFVENWAPREP